LFVYFSGISHELKVLNIKGTPPFPVVACLSDRIWQRPPYLHKASYTFSNEWSWRWQFELSHSCLSALRYDFDHWQGVLISQFAWFLSQPGWDSAVPPLTWTI